MVTLRAYSNPAEAALAKSLLDDHNILCSLADENAYFYGGAPLAMPVRILVADEQADEAELSQQSPTGKNPWEILAFASLLLIPGLSLLLQKNGLILVAWRGRRISRTSLTTFSPATAHVFGALVIGVALLLTILFFYIRRVIMREQIAAGAVALCPEVRPHAL